MFVSKYLVIEKIMLSETGTEAQKELESKGFKCVGENFYCEEIWERKLQEEDNIDIKL